jgi:uncharacterized membrane protein
MFENRPRIQLKLTQTDKLLEIASIVMLSGLLLYSLIAYTMLPETIPMHFNGKGQADGWGPRISIFFSPLLALASYILLTLLNRRPDVFNYPVKITSENALHHYILATRMIRMLKLSLIIMFGAITWSVVYSAGSNKGDTVMWVLPFSLIITFLPIAYYFLKVFIKQHQAPSKGLPKKNHRSKYKLY